ncbi:uncharacterized protein LOC143036076 [Oratosquilla oratoria]|uniref:uncharacterized protein LOC143036076 n=1 Tax=Oratosquilla oratoria TaxID=337810 RepID=UPI003F7747B9
MDYPYYCSPSQGYPDDGQVPEGRCTPPRLFPGQADDDDDDDVPSLRFPEEAMEKLEQLVGPCLDYSPRGQADSNLFPMQEPYCPVKGSSSSSLVLPRSQTKVAKLRKKKRDSVCQARTAEASTCDWGQAAAAAAVPLEGPLHMPHRLSDTTTPSSFSSPISLSSCDSFDPYQDNEPSTTTDGMGSVVAGDHRVPRQRKPKTSVKSMTPEEKRLHIRENNRSPSRRSREKKKSYIDGLSDDLQRLELDNCRLNRHCQELEDEYTMWRTIEGIVHRSPVDGDPQAPPFSSSLGRHPF